MKILVIGKNGQLARCLADEFKGKDFNVAFSSQSELDVSDLEKTKTKLKKIKPKIIINTSAYTAVDKAENDYETANKLNHLAVESMANLCKSIDCSLIHISTDYVFDGEGFNYFKEDNKTNPQTVYGKTKLLGEMAVKKSGCNHIIIRTAWLFSGHGRNFLKTIIQLSHERDELNIVGDQIGCPTYTNDLARAIIAVIPYSIDTRNSGIYHFAGSSSCSWAEFAENIFMIALAEKKILKKPKINVTTSAESSASAKRPLNSRIDSSLFEESFKFPPSDWKQGIKKVIAEGESWI